MSSSKQLHHQFFRQIENNSQKIGLILDEQMLSFAEMMHCVQAVAIHLIKEKHSAQADEIVCQMLQRSVELPIAYFAVLTAGRVYCALNPADSPSAINQIIDQLGNVQYVLVHEATEPCSKTFNQVRIDEILTANLPISDEDLQMLSTITGRRAFVTCTSGTTGKPKLIAHTHESALCQTRIFSKLGFISPTDTVVTWVSSSFIIHLMELAYTWLNGASLVVLKEGGHMDIDYLTCTIERYQGTFLLISPAVLPMLTKLFSQQADAIHRLKSLRILATAGDTVKTSVLEELLPYLPETASYVNLFGQSECQSISTFKIDDLKHASFDSPLLPNGRAVPECQVALFDEHEQQITTPGTVGELYVAGPGIFQEYLHEPELTEQRLQQINGVRYVRTGDLQKWDENENLVQVSRVDFQIKMRGQRLEPAEIEDVIIKASSDIHECLVMKIEHNEEDYLVAYLAATAPDNEEKKLTNTVEEACRSLLPPIKHPSIYLILQENKFPRSPNGKIIRSALPQPTFPTADLSLKTEHSLPTEDDLQQLWQLILPNREMIPLDANWYHLGGNSLDIMKLLSEYQRSFVHSRCELPYAQLLQHATIEEHTKILRQTLQVDQGGEDHRTTQLVQLQRTDATKGPINACWMLLLDSMDTPCSQSRIKWRSLNVVLVFHVTRSSVSIQRLRHALHFAVKKHETLHTSVKWDSTNQQWTQQIESLDDEGFSLVIDQLRDYQNNIDYLVQKEYASDIHDVTHGRLVRLHIVHNSDQNERNDDEIVPGDIIVINIRHESIDGTSAPILFDTLTQAYSSAEEPRLDSRAIRYLDYMLYLQQCDLSSSYAYWNEQMASFNSARHSSRIPVDRPPNLGDTACISIHITSFRVDRSVLEAMINCATMNNVTLATVCAACHAAFLFELTDDWDVAFETVVASRPRESEAIGIVGNFFYLPIVRVRLENTAETTFLTLLENVQLLINHSLLHARAQWSFDRKNTSEKSADDENTSHPISSFQFEEYRTSFALDVSIENGPVLEYVHNERDGLLAGVWARAGVCSSFYTEAFYMLPDRRLIFGMFFSSASYNRATAERLCQQFEDLIRRLFLNVSPDDRLTKPLSTWLRPTASSFSG